MPKPDFRAALKRLVELDDAASCIADRYTQSWHEAITHARILLQTVEVDERLSTAILAHPGFSGCHDGPVASAAQGEVDELVAALEADAECVAAEQADLCNMTADQMRRIAQLLKGLPNA